MKANHTSRANSLARPAVFATGIGPRRVARWNRIRLLTVLLALAGPGATAVLASDPVGIYAIVDKVVFEPNETSPERIQIWGAFAIAEGRGETYKNAERGFLYYKLNPEKSTLCRNEWSDLKSVAGTGQIVAFGSRYEEKGTLRKKGDKAEKPDEYPIAMGLKKVPGAKDYEPLKQLARLRDEKSKTTPAGEKPVPK